MMNHFTVDGSHHSPYSVNTVHLDHFEELTWVGTTEGRVTSYYDCADTSRYTSFNVSNSQEFNLNY